MHDSPYFSIVTPVLNGREFVARYVQCLKSQSFSRWEACIVDDGSTDATVHLLHSLVHNDLRFRVFCNPLKKAINGPYQARNYALNLVRGKYICFLDIDDLWVPQKLFYLFENLHNSSEQPILSFSSYFRVNPENHLIYKRFSSWIIPPHFLIRFVNIVPMLTSCISADFLESTNIRFLPVNHEDYLFWKSIFDVIPASRVSIDNRLLAFYVMRSESLSGNKFRALFWLANCYDHFGYTFLRKMLAFLLRFGYEVLSMLRSLMAGHLRLQSDLNDFVLNSHR